MEGLLPLEGFPVSVDHREVSVKVPESVADESAYYRANHLCADHVEDYESVSSQSRVYIENSSNKVHYSVPVRFGMHALY